MAFTYVIEHMEEDEQISAAVPPWVRLEYVVSRKHKYHVWMTITRTGSTAHANSGRSGL